MLGVSEASVRRWSDAGLLASHRVGRRGERRFARSDLLGLRSAGRQGRPGPEHAVFIEGSPVPVHTHLTSLFTSDVGRLTLGLPFLRDGLVAGQACILMAHPQTARLIALQADLAMLDQDFGAGREGLTANLMYTRNHCARRSKAKHPLTS